MQHINAWISWITSSNSFLLFLKRIWEFVSSGSLCYKSKRWHTRERKKCFDELQIVTKQKLHWHKWIQYVLFKPFFLLVNHQNRSFLSNMHLFYCLYNCIISLYFSKVHQFNIELIIVKISNYSLSLLTVGCLQFPGNNLADSNWMCGHRCVFIFI